MVNIHRTYCCYPTNSAASTTATSTFTALDPSCSSLAYNHLPSVLAPLPSSVLPITPTIHIYTEADDFTQSAKQHQEEQQSLDSNLENPQNRHWTAPWRAGLPTPPNDMMNGVAYNTFVPSTSTTTTTNPNSYGGKHNGLSLHPYGKFPSQSRSNIDPTSLYSSSSKPQSHVAPPSTKNVPPAESVSQKKTTSTSVPSYLQIPSSISDRKGSLAEFAAQV